MDDAKHDGADDESTGAGSGSDPFHDFTVPQDADFVAAPTPNADEDEGSKLDDDPLGSDD